MNQRVHIRSRARQLNSYLATKKRNVTELNVVKYLSSLLPTQRSYITKYKRFLLKVIYKNIDRIELK